MIYNRQTNCYKCKNRLSIRNDYHSQCSNPDSKMTGNETAIKKGWFDYPNNFDPIWKTKKCTNFKAGGA